MNRLRLFVVFLVIMLVGGCTVSRYGSAEKYIRQREYDKAVRAYLKLLDPHLRQGKRYIFYDREAVTGIGVAYWRMRRYQTAIKILRMVISKDPGYGKARFYLGMSLEGMGRDDEAIDVYRDYALVSASDYYRRIMVGRMDWLVRKQMIREVQLALNNEAQLNVSMYPEKSVAVLYFLSLSDDPQWKPLQKGLAEMMITDLSQVEELTVVERLRVHQLMEELNLSATGLMDENTSPRVGKLLGARSLIKGSYMVMPTHKMTLDAGVYRIGELTNPDIASMDGNLARLFRMEKELVLRILDYFQIKLTPQQREKILEIPTENMLAFMNYCRGLEALDSGDYEGAYGFFNQAVRIDGGFQLARDHLMTPRLWQITHNRNLIRVGHDVAESIDRMPRGRAEAIYAPPTLVSTWNRLQTMAGHQSAGFIPGNDARESVQEAAIVGAPVVPEQLAEPPIPPN